MIHQNKPRVAVVVGYHSFEVQPFYDLFTAMEDFHFYIQHLEQFTSSSKEARQSYDAVVFYIMRPGAPVNDGPWYEGQALEALEQLGETRQGLLMLHHSLLAFPQWPRWAELCGIDPASYRDYHLDAPMRWQVADDTHPITRGMAGFSIEDEAYEMGPAGGDVRVLLRCDEPRNTPTVGWVHQYRQAPVFCLQGGHGPAAWANPHFAALLRRGLRWLCALPEEA